MMAPLDWVMVIGYFALLLGIAWWVILKNKDTADDYFLAGRNLGWFIVGASIFASNIGSEHLVGLAGSGCTDGVAMAHYELHAWCLLVLAWVFVPFYARSKVFTMPEFLEKRFNESSRWVLSVISLVAYVLTKVAVGIFAGGIVFRTLLPEVQLDIGVAVLDSFWIGSFLVIILTGIYTVLGGLRAVAYTEAIQTIILVAGSVLVTIFGLNALGGWGELQEICGSDMFNLWKPLIPEGYEGTWSPIKEGKQMAWYFNGNYPWLGMLFCAPIIGLWYWCTDQYIVQRALGAPNEQQARRGSIFAAFLKLLPVFIFIIPGMICFALAASGKMDVLRDNLYTGGELNPELSQAAFPLLVKHVLPAGVRGIVVAGLLAALMSSLSGVFNASSTLFTMDLYSKFRPQASQHQLVWTGRIVTTIMVIIGLAWVPVIQGAHGLYDYLQGVQGYLAPPIFVVFFLGVFFKRLNGAGCLAALIVGFVLGVFRLIVDTPVKLATSGFDVFAAYKDGYAEGSFLWIVNNIYFQYYSLFIFLVCVVVMVAVSYVTRSPDHYRITGLTYGTITDEHRRESRSSWTTRDVLASCLVLVLIIAAYLYFTG
ncbi:MAG: sodium:solute symporter [Pirellulales bacterium]|nr:sodium:solute symporter [Pirellulales bacterium]